MENLFGTDGIRGEVNLPPLEPETILKIGQGLAEFWRGNEEKQRIIIGHDGRMSADYIQNLLAAALQGTGFKVENIGLTTTPGLAFVTAKREAAGGIMISASHNPYYDNGIKPFQATGEKFSDELESRVENIIQAGNNKLARREDIGVSEAKTGLLDDYVEHLVNKFMGGFNGSVLIDCANGGASNLVLPILEKICEKLTVINNEPSGQNINKNSGSLHLDTLKEKKKEVGADLAFALDGDGDRLLAVDEEDELVNGDSLLYMLASYLQKNEQLSGGMVITVMSNLGLRRALQEAEIDFSVVGVGDRKVYRELLNRDWVLGGEQSGHIINRHHLPTGDGLNTLVAVLSILAAEEKNLADYNRMVPEYPQVLHNVKVDTKPPIMDLEKSQQKIEEIEDKLGEEGRVLVRYSGTEPVARIMLEGRDKQQLDDYARQIGQVMVEEINKYAG
ncbi:MAG: phosphoglucosamine mutase [bacterium]